MPEELIKTEKEKRCGFADKFREKSLERDKEYASYKLEKMKSKNEKKGRK